MLKTTVKTWPWLAVLLSVAMLAATAVAEDAKEASSNGAAKPPQRQMLYKIFAPLMHDIGARSPRKATIVSGPVEMKMANNQQPGKQWWVRIGRSKFKVTIEDSAGLTIEKALSYTERVPTLYLRCLEIVSEDKKAGLAFYKSLGGAAAHGGQGYLNMIPLEPSRAASVIVHEAGHILEQRARSVEPDILDRWAEAVKSDHIDVSRYGNHVNHEDQAEFARLYAFCLDDEMGDVKLRKLEELSPARFALWERMLELSGANKE